MQLFLDTLMSKHNPILCVLFSAKEAISHHEPEDSS